MFSHVGSRLGQMLAEKIAERFKSPPGGGDATNRIRAIHRRGSPDRDDNHAGH